MNNEKRLTVCWHHGFAVQCHCSNFGLPDEESQTSGKHLWQTVKFAINKQFWKDCHMKKEKWIEEMLLEDVRVVTDLFCSRCFLYHYLLPSPCFLLVFGVHIKSTPDSGKHSRIQRVFIPAVNIKPFLPVISRSIWASVIYATGSVMSFYKGYHLLYTLLLLMWSLQQEVQTVVTQTDSGVHP